MLLHALTGRQSSSPFAVGISIAILLSRSIGSQQLSRSTNIVGALRERIIGAAVTLEWDEPGSLVSYDCNLEQQLAVRGRRR